MHPQRKWREDAEISQKRLSVATEMLGYEAVDQGMISKIENNASYPGIEMALRLCIAQAKLSSIVPPMRLTQYGPSDLALTYSQTMEAHANGLAKGTAAEATYRGLLGGGKATKKAAPKAVQVTHQRTRPWSSISRKRKAAKTAKAKGRKR